MFRIAPIKIGRFSATRLVNSNDEYVEILTDLGAGLNAINIKSQSGKRINCIKGYSSEKEIIELHHNAFRGNILSPYPNRIRDGKFKLKDVTHQFPIHFPNEQNSIHGLLHHKKFDVVSSLADEKHAFLHIKLDYLGTDQGFPFPYTIEVFYTLTADGIKIETKSKHRNQDPIPLALGWHPYFRFEGSIEDVSLKLPKVLELSVDDRMIPNGQSQSFDNFEILRPIGETVLDTCFKLENSSSKSITNLATEEIQLEIWTENQENQFDYLQIFTPPTRDSIAIEPMTAPPNAFNSELKNHLQEPGIIKSSTFGIQWK